MRTDKNKRQKYIQFWLTIVEPSRLKRYYHVAFDTDTVQGLYLFSPSDIISVSVELTVLILFFVEDGCIHAYVHTCIHAYMHTYIHT